MPVLYSGRQGKYQQIFANYIFSAKIFKKSPHKSKKKEDREGGRKDRQTDR